MSFNLVSDLSLLSFLTIMFNIFNTDSVSVLIFLLKSEGYLYNSSLISATILLILCSSIKSVQIIGHL